jgi:hypothetical protein
MSDYYIEEIAAILNVPRSVAVRLASGMDDGAIDLGVCMHRHEEARRRELIDGDSGEAL